MMTYKNGSKKVDQFVIDELSKDSQTYFKKQHTREKIQTMFKSSCTPHEKNGFVFNPTVRCKINVSGPKCITCYDSEKNKINIPSDWREYNIRPIIHVKSVWFMASNVGITFEIQDCLLRKTESTCPF